MNNTFTFLAAAFLGVAAQAQITIVSTDLGSVGDQVTYITDTTSAGSMMAPATGSAQTFNYSTLGVADFDDIHFLDPATTPAASFFPNANLAIDVPGNNLVYAIKSTTSMDIDGIFGDILGQGIITPIDLKPNLTLIPFPLDYQDTYSDIAIVDTVVEDTFSGFFDSLRLKRSLEVVSLVDAYGDLQLPSLTESVLRLYQVETTTDSLFGKVLGFWQPVTQTMVSEYYYRFLAKNRDYYVMEVQTDNAGVIIDAQYQSGGALVAGILNYSQISCYGMTDGSAKVDVTGGLPPYSFQWDNAGMSTTAQISNLPAGTYNVTVTDANTDFVVAQIQIIEPDSIAIAASSIGADFGSDDGFININVSGGTPPYTYLWSDGQTTKNAINLAAGNYTVTATDSENCSQTASFTVDNLSSIQSISNEFFTVFPNPSRGEFTISTERNWEVKIYSLTGSMVFNQKGQGTEQLDITSQPSGLYIIEVRMNSEFFVGKIQILK